MIEPKIDLREALQALDRALAAEEGGKRLKRDLAKRLRGVMEPIRQRTITRVLALPSSGHSGESMRQAIARQTRAAVRFRGDNTGVSLIQRARGMPRNFQYAGRAFNRTEGWHPKTLSGQVVTQQIRPAKWFDEPVADVGVSEIKAQIVDALEDMAARIAGTVKKG